MAAEMPTRTPASSSAVVALWVIAVVAALFFLRAARTLLIPIAIAVLISYAFAPLVTWMERRHVPRLLGAGLVLLMVLAAIAGGGYALKNDAKEIGASVPKAVERARGMVGAQLGSAGHSSQESAGGGQSGSPASGGGSGEQASGGGSGQQALVQRGVGAVLSAAGHLVVIFFLTYFLLISGDHVRNRLIEITGREPERRRTTAAVIDDINAHIQRYLLVLLVTAVIVAIATWVVLALMGVRHAAMWGILAGVFNSIPYFGPVIVAGGLFVVGMVQGGGVTQALQMSGAAIAITSLEGWLLTPPLMGKAERMSALAVFLGLLLWTWIWGAWGTVLAVPMLVVIKSVADHVAPLKPIGRLMAP